MAERELSIFLISAARLRELKFSEGAAARRRRDERESSFFSKRHCAAETAQFFKASLRGGKRGKESSNFLKASHRRWHYAAKRAHNVP